VEATRQIVSQFPEVKVIALSMHSDSLFVLNMLNAGASGYLLKDCALEELVKAIHTVVTKEIYLSVSLSDMLVTDLANKFSLDDYSSK
jgi:two-component system response regulator NreC